MLLIFVLLLCLPVSSNFFKIVKSISQRFLQTESTNTSACSNGCLKCNSSSLLCEICDMEQGYFINNGYCNKSSVSHCSFYLDFGKCAICEEGYYLDRSKLCFEVIEPIENCLTYSSYNKCSICVSGFASRTGSVCARVEAPIRGCQNYDSDEFCIKCLDGFSLDPISKTCKSIDLVDNCALYTSPYKCESCQKDFLKIPNMYNLNIVEYFTKINLHLKLSTTEYKDKTLNLPFCKWKHSIAYCVEYNSHGECLSCKEGYFLDLSLSQQFSDVSLQSFIQLDLSTLETPEVEGSDSYNTFYNNLWTSYRKLLDSKLYGTSCVKNPLTRISAKIGISNCYLADRSTCKICFNNYYLDSDSYCQPHSNIADNCFLMSQKTKDSCLICDPSFYLKSSTSNVNANLCESRSNSFIDKCQEFSLNADKCSKCFSPFIKHNNGLSCSAPIDNCFSYKLDESSLKCKSCTSGYLLSADKTSCSSQLDTCSFRTQNTNNCIVCKKGYYLSESLECISWNEFEVQQIACNQAKQISVAVGSNDASPTLTCHNCLDGFFKKIFFNECVLNGTAIVPHCTHYDSDQNCLKCASNYYLNGSSCSTGSITGCLIYTSASVCETCNIGYMLNNGSCLDLSNREIHSGFFSDSVKCLKWSENNNDITCDVCLPNHIIKKEVDKYVFTECINSLEQSPQISNCLVEDLSYQENNAGVVKCAKCEGNFYKNSGNIAIGLGSSCVSSCGLNEMPDNVLGTCQPKLATFPINNCSKGDGRSLCYSCDSGHKAKYNLHFFHQSLYLWQTDYHSVSGNEIKHEQQKPFIEECINDSNAEVSFFFEVQNNTFEYRQFKTQTVINGSTQYINVKNCDTSSSLIFDQSDLNYALTCHKCAFDPFKKMSLTIVPVQLKLEDVSLLDTGETVDLTTSNMPYLSCHTQLTLDETDPSIKNQKLRFCYVQFYDMFREKFVCKVCNPGYKAIYGDSNEIIECEKIQNCDLTITPGICDKCDENYIFGSVHPEDQVNEFSDQSRNSNINKTECIFLGSDSEYILAIDQKNDNTPIACKSGARLNFLTNSCDPLISDKNQSVSQCKGYSNQSCLECKAGYWMKFSYKNIHQCKLADDLVFRNSGCAIFKNNITSFDNTFSSDDIQCLQCYTGYQLDPISETCIYVKNIYNCAVYNIDNINSPKCSQCSIGFELNDNFFCDEKSDLLPEEQIKNCSLLDDQKNCALCKQNYYLLKTFDFILQAQTTICEKIPLPLNCEQIDMELFKNEQKILCTKCRNTYELEFYESSELSTGCQQLNSISNCKVQTGANCQECQIEYYLNAGNKCEERTNYSVTCLEFHKDQDSCKLSYQIEAETIDDSSITKIQESLFISVENADLIDYFVDLPVISNMPPKEDPDNLIEYQVYINQTRCKLCKSKYWLDIVKNECNPVYQLISNCQYYASSSECFSCNKDYILINNNCIFKTNYNCLENENGSQCLTCPPSKPILNSNKDCEAPTDIPDCKEYVFDKTIGAFICSQCNSYFYLDEGHCFPISSQVEKCLIYNEEGICRVCYDGYYFETNTSSCELVTLFEANCKEFISGGQCSVCEKGYYMNFLGTCNECSVDLQKCAFCDPLKPTQCLVCNSGYYMNAQNECVQ